MLKETVSLSEFIRRLVSIGNNESNPSYSYGDTFSIKLVEDYLYSDGVRVEIHTNTAETFREAVAASFNKNASKKTQKPLNIRIAPTSKGINIPLKAIQYLGNGDRVYLRPLEGETEKFLINASAGEGVCYPIYRRGDRFIITPTIQRKAFGQRIDGYNDYRYSHSKVWSVSQNGQNHNSLYFSRN